MRLSVLRQAGTQTMHLLLPSLTGLGLKDLSISIPLQPPRCNVAGPHNVNRWYSIVTST